MSCTNKENQRKRNEYVFTKFSTSLSNNEVLLYGKEHNESGPFFYIQEGQWFAKLESSANVVDRPLVSFRVIYSIKKTSFD